MSGGPNKWTQIQVTNKKPSEMQDLEINLEEELVEGDQGDQQGGNDQGSNQQATNRTSNGVQTPAKNEDSKTGTKVQQSQKTNVTQGSQVNEEDDGEEPQGQSRRARRIRFLSSRVQELEAQLGQERAGRNSIIQEKNQIQANHVTQQAAFYKARVDEKTSEYEKAVESNDPKAQAKALRELNDAQIKAQVYEAAEQEVEDEPQQQAPQVRAAQPQQAPQAALRWVEKNKWFMTNEAAHLATRAVNARLMQEGYDPNSDDFYEELDERLSSEGLDLNKLNGVQPQNQQRPQNQGQQSAAVRQQRKSPVGSSEGETQGNSNDSGRTQFKREGNKVLVTPSDDDREMAENLGTPIETYMQSKLIYEEHGGKGYTPIVIRGKR